MKTILITLAVISVYSIIIGIVYRLLLIKYSQYKDAVLLISSVWPLTILFIMTAELVSFGSKLASLFIPKKGLQK